MVTDWWAMISALFIYWALEGSWSPLPGFIRG